MKPRLADATLAGNFPRLQHFEEECIDGEIVRARRRWHVGCHTKDCVVKFFHFITAVLSGMFQVEDALRFRFDLLLVLRVCLIRRSCRKVSYGGAAPLL